MTTLFEPIQIGDIALANRIVMAPLTRNRAVAGNCPGPLTVEYYRQRATAGLIVAEASPISPMAQGYLDTPGIWSAEQVAAWRAVTDAVHAEGGKIVLQLWHVGRISHVSLLPDGAAPVSATARTAEASTFTRDGFVPVSAPRALRDDELPGLVEDYRKAARNAIAAGFDGVEIHAANGYLIEQFLATKTNLRTDDFGGSIENRMRFLLEVTDAVVAVAGAGRVGVHLSPRCDANDSGNDDSMELFPVIARELGKRKLAFLFTREAEGPDSLMPILRSEFGGPVIANEKFTPETAEATIAEGRADAVAWGKFFISNPDLPRRLKTGAAFAPFDMTTFYGVGGLGPKGYTDYPALG